MPSLLFSSPLPPFCLAQRPAASSLSEPLLRHVIPPWPHGQIRSLRRLPTRHSSYVGSPRTPSFRPRAPTAFWVHLSPSTHAGASPHPSQAGPRSEESYAGPSNSRLTQLALPADLSRRNGSWAAVSQHACPLQLHHEPSCVPMVCEINNNSSSSSSSSSRSRGIN